MKIAVLNLSGNVGKTTISRQLLAPRLGAEVITVESVNDTETADALRGREFGTLLDRLGMATRAVIDVGASNAEDFLEHMGTYRNSQDEIDRFVVPVVSAPKQMKDTIATITWLADLGIAPGRIKTVFNMVDYRDVLDSSFRLLFDFHRAKPMFSLLPDAVIHQNELFSKLEGRAVSDLVADQTDYKALRAEADDPNDRLRLTRLLSLVRLAHGVSEEFDQVYKVLTA